MSVQGLIGKAGPLEKPANPNDPYKVDNQSRRLWFVFILRFAWEASGKYNAPHRDCCATDGGQ